MKELIFELPDNILDTIQLELTVNKEKFSSIENIVFCGMGGSGIIGEIIKNILQDRLDIPFVVNQDYTLPKFVSSNTLVIFSSYSGNTEETISCFLEAKERGCKMFSFTSGGELMRLSNEIGVDLIPMSPGNPPRSTIGFAFIYVLKILDAVGIIAANEIFADLTDFVKSLNQNELNAEAEQIATFIRNKNVIVYSENKYKPILTRFKQQLNENSKVLCHYDVFPEMNHNEIVGWGVDMPNRAVLFLNSEDFHPRNKIRFEFTKKLVASKTDVLQIDSKGSQFVLRMVYLIHLLDIVTYHLAELNGIDIMDIDVINALKEELANS
jgi:glucose/mannose-6-phosphate isomerase